MKERTEEIAKAAEESPQGASESWFDRRVREAGERLKAMTDEELRIFLHNKALEIESDCWELTEMERISGEQAEELLNEDPADCMRADFILALRELTERGKAYRPFSWEEVRRSALESLGKLREIRFSTGGYFGGYDDFTAKVSDSASEPEVLEALTDGYYRFGREYTILCPKEEAMELVESIRLGEWEEDYQDPMVCDGCQWDFAMEFDGTVPDLRVNGSNAFPESYGILEDFFFRAAGIPREEGPGQEGGER